jgi:hypothetical protein
LLPWLLVMDLPPLLLLLLAAGPQVLLLRCTPP